MKEILEHPFLLTYLEWRKYISKEDRAAKFKDFLVHIEDVDLNFITSFLELVVKYHEIEEIYKGTNWKDSGLELAPPLPISGSVVKAWQEWEDLETHWTLPVISDSLVLPRRTNVDDVRFAEIFAKEAHKNAKSLYDGKSYSTHLEKVLFFIHKYRDFNQEAWFHTAEVLGWLHDIIEETHVTQTNISELFGPQIASTVHALTPDKHLSRRELLNSDFYSNLHNFPHAVFVKICDRLANVEYCTYFPNPKKMKMYRTEQARFRKQLYKEEHHGMWEELEFLLNFQR